MIAPSTRSAETVPRKSASLSGRSSESPSTDGQALPVRDILDLVDDLREEWVRQVGDEDRDHSQAAER